jgi:hypothetical protein
MSRLVRRVFAPSFIVTVAGSASLVGAEPAPPRPPPVIHKNPPPPQHAPTTDRHWQVYQQDKKCFASNAADACPPPPKGAPMRSCNPPPPAAYACPENVTLPVKIIQRANTMECFVDYGPMTCPKGASCNPPPPHKLACP